MTAEDIFLAAVEKPVPERAAYLATACGADAGLRAEVDALLRSHEQAGSLLEQPLFRPDLTVDQATPPERPGATIGQYKLVEEIGEGGMGTVFLAEQTEPVRRPVALKVIKAGMDTRQVIARFEAERQALALMDHPNIAKVFDGGATPAGRPYFVMELVNGVPITKYCDDNRLTPRQRLELFVPICHAIQHAHQKGIIHRDLKPSNVLVALYDEKPVPKVIDFGVAKATDQQLTQQLTVFGTVVGTIEYMSPEQASLNQLDIDTRSDIYSLGVLLYELLAGSPPFTRKELATAGMLEMLRVIREQEPSKPSTRLSTADGLSTLAANRGTEPARLTKLIRGELDWIAMKALEKDRSRRYETANGLAMDVQRYLADESVLACPPSVGYRLRKFVRRNRWPVTVAISLVCALILGVAGSSWQALRASAAEKNAVAEGREKDLAKGRAEQAERLATQHLLEVTEQKHRADDEASISSTVNEFLLRDLLGQLDPLAQFDRGFVVEPGLTVRTTLDRAAARIGDRFRDKPLVEATIRQVIGDCYRSLGEPALAVPHLERARELFAGQLGQDNPRTLHSAVTLAGAYWQLRTLDKAFDLAAPTLDRARESLGPEHDDSLSCAQALSAIYLWAGRADLALPMLKELLAVCEKKFGPNGISTMRFLNNLGAAYRDLGHLDLALETFSEALARKRKNLKVGHPDILPALRNVASTYLNLKNPERARELFVEALKGFSEIHPPDHRDVLETKAGLGCAKRDGGQVEEGLKDMEEAWRLGNRHPNIHWVGLALTRTYAEAGRTDRAQAFAHERAALARNQLPADSIQLAGALGDLGYALVQGKAHDAAEPLLRQSLAIWEKTQPDHWIAFQTRAALGGSLLGQKRFADAEKLLREGVEGIKKAVDMPPPDFKIGRNPDRSNIGLRRQRLTEAISALVELYDAWKKPDDAAKWRKELESRRKP